MSRLAIWNADSLLGREIKDALANRRDLWTDLRLLSESSEDSLVTDIGGDAALVLPATVENLEDVTLLFYCGEAGPQGELPATIPMGLPTILAADDPIPGAIPGFVAGVNTSPERMREAGAVIASAHPVLVALAHLLHPLLSLGLEECTASVILPGSSRGQQGIDALLDQTRSILAFQPQEKNEVFDFQLAFNLVPGSPDGDSLAPALGEILGSDTELAIQTSLGGIFHCLTLGAHVRLAEGVSEADVQEALVSSEAVEFTERPEALGPVTTAGSDRVQLAPVEVSTARRGFWLRAVMDNLTLGGALNAIGLAEAVLKASTSEPPGYTM